MISGVVSHFVTPAMWIFIYYGDLTRLKTLFFSFYTSKEAENFIILGVRPLAYCSGAKFGLRAKMRAEMSHVRASRL